MVHIPYFCSLQIMIQSLTEDKLLASFPTFDKELADLIMEHGSIKTFAADDLIMRPGQFIRSTILVLKGRIKVSKQGEEGDELFMYYLEPGNACALSMICASKQEKSELLAKVIEDTEVIMLPVALMDELMGNYKSWYYFVLETYRQRFEELLTLIDHTVFRSMDERLLFYLKKQQESMKSNELKLTHEQIAEDLGSSRVVISRLLKQMEKDGKVKLFRSHLELVNI